MSHKRNTTGLALAAKMRRQDTLKRVNEAISSLQKKGKTINFNSVSKASGVGKTWLYKETDIRKQILKFRVEVRKNFDDDHKPLSASKMAIVEMLKKRVRELETENKELKKQIEVIYGELHQKQ